MTSSDPTIDERVHEALTEPMSPDQVAALDARLERGRSRRVPIRGRAVRRSLLLVALVAIALPLAVIAGIVPGSDEAPPSPELESRVAALFSEETCVVPQDAALQIGAILADLGLTGWTVEHGTGAADSECVAASLDGQTRTVLLLMALPPDVREGLAAVQEQSYTECLTREEAVAAVDAVLVAAGMAGRYRIESGPLSVPGDRVEEIEAHVASGCWVYSMTGWTADGTRMFWVAGE